MARPSPGYEPRSPTQSVLYQIVRDHVETFRAQAGRVFEGERLPRFIDEEFDGRDVFLMREIAGLGYDEIASACGLTPDAVRSRIHRARLELRRQLAAPVATRRTTPVRRSGEAIRERA